MENISSIVNFCFAGGTGFWVASSILLVVFSSVLLILSTRGLRVIAPVHLFLLYYICFLYIGSISNFMYSPGEYARTFRLVSLGLFFFGAGALFGSLYHGFNQTHELERIRLQPLTDPWEEAGQRHTLVLVFLGGLALSFLYFYHAGGIPAFAEVVETARVNAVRGAGYFWLGISIVLPFACLSFIGKALVRRGPGAVAAAVLCVLLTCLIMLLTATKDLVPFFLLWIVFFIQFHSGRLNKGLIVLPFVSLFVALLLSGFTMAHQLGLEQNTTFLSFAAEKLTERVALYVVYVVRFLVENIPTKYGYFFGYTYWMNLRAALMPGHFLGFGGWVNAEAFDMGGGATVPLVAELYANFGEPAAYAGMLLAGFVVQSVYIHLLRSLAREKSLDKLIAVTFLGMGFVTLAINSVFGYLLYTLAPVGACLVFMRVFPRFLPVANNSRET